MELKQTNKLIIGITLLFFILGLFNMHEGHEWGDDFSLYLSQSDAIVNGKIHELYTKNRWMMEHSERPMGPFLYPFGFPAYLSPVTLIAPGALFILKIWNWLFAAVAVFFLLKMQVHLQEKNGKATIAGLFVTVYFILHPKFIERSDHLLSDVFFCSLCFLFFYVLYVLKENKFRTLLLFILMLFAAETRSNGIFLLPVYLVHYAFEQKRFSDLFRRSAFLSFNGPWVLCVLTLLSITLINGALPAGSENHWSYLSRVSVSQLLSNSAYYFKLIGEFPLYYIVKFIGYGIAGKLLVSFSWILIVTGLIHTGKKHLSLLFWFVLNIGLYIVWPFVQGVRFILPVAPLIIWYFVAGLQYLISRMSLESRVARVIPAVMVILLVQAMAVSYYNFKRDTNKAFTADAADMYTYCNKNIPENTAVSFFKPRLFYFATGKPAVYTESDSFYRQSEARYRILENSVNVSKSTVLETEVYRNNSFAVFKRID